METNTAIEPKANDLISIYQGLGWMLTAFSPETFKYLWINDESHEISKLRFNVSLLDKDTANHFSEEKKKKFKLVLNSFIKTNTKYREAKSWYKKWHLYMLRKIGKKAYYETVNMLADYELKK